MGEVYLMTKAADGSGEGRAITEVAGQAYAEDLTRDDAVLLFSANPSTARGKFEIFRVELKNGAKPTLPHVQCEACHGAGGTHMEQARARAIEKGAIAKAPNEEV